MIPVLAEIAGIATSQRVAPTGVIVVCARICRAAL